MGGGTDIGWRRRQGYAPRAVVDSQYQAATNGPVTTTLSKSAEHNPGELRGQLIPPAAPKYSY